MNIPTRNKCKQKYTIKNKNLKNQQKIENDYNKAKKLKLPHIREMNCRQYCIRAPL
jgi:translation elongation factor P/translation initiation factor 5A